jgi:hypothetical protein
MKQPTTLPRAPLHVVFLCKQTQFSLQHHSSLKMEAVLFSETSMWHSVTTLNTRLWEILQYLPCTLTIYSRTTNVEASWLLAPTIHGTLLNLPARIRSSGSPGRNGSGLRKDWCSGQGVNTLLSAKSGSCRSKRRRQHKKLCGCAVITSVYLASGSKTLHIWGSQWIHAKQITTENMYESTTQEMSSH